MSIWELFITAVALSMDAFAVSVCKGLAVDKVKFRHCMITGAWFGGFQMLMPLIGYFAGVLVAPHIEAVDHWIAFALLLLIGIGMIIEACKKDDEAKKEEKESSSFDFKTMITLAVATSIDALAVGVTFAFLSANIWWATLFIGATTFTLSAVGVKVGNVFGAKNKSAAEIIGGAVLILMGIKILLEHLGVLPF